jgi:hypothetical protein
MGGDRSTLWGAIAQFFKYYHRFDVASITAVSRRVLDTKKNTFLSGD